MATKQVHMSLCVAGVLSDWPRWQDAFVDDTGRRAKRSEVLAHFKQLAAEGVKVVPFQGPPCEGWSDQTGCPGHPVPDGEDPLAWEQEHLPPVEHSLAPALGGE